jgi:hypothetical protein
MLAASRSEPTVLLGTPEIHEGKPVFAMGSPPNWSARARRRRLRNSRHGLSISPLDPSSSAGGTVTAGDVRGPRAGDGLGLKNAEQALKIVQRYIPAKLLTIKIQLIVESLFESDT